MWIPNVPLLSLQVIVFIVMLIAAYKDNKYYKEFFLTGKTHKRANFWYILFMICVIGTVFGLIGQLFSYLAEMSP